jgi:hypothetical protein
MEAQANYGIYQSHLRLSVGQLDKLHLPTLKTADTNPLRVGRQQNETPRKHTRIRENLQSPKRQVYKLYQKTERDFLKAIPIVFEQLENQKVVFHNTDYVDAICDDYYPEFSSLFLEWVKTFAIIRSSYRVTLIEGVILSNDDDFLTALRLIQSQGIKPRLKPKEYHNKIWNAIQKYFHNVEFKGTDLIKKLIVDAPQIHKVLNDLTASGKLSKTKKAGFSSYFYKVVQA